MLIALPTRYGSIYTHAVKPGSEDTVSEAVERYDDEVNTRAVRTAVIMTTVILLAGLAAALTFLPGNSVGERTASVFITLGLFAFGLLTFPAIFFWMRSGARERLTSNVEEHVVKAFFLDHVYQSGEATDEQEWRAAHLATEASDLRHEAWKLRRDPHNFNPIRLTPAREAEAASMEVRAQRLDAQVAKLLDPPVRRRVRKRAVVG